MKIKLKTLWNNKAGIRDKYIDELHKSQQDLTLEFKGKLMTIKFEDLDRKIAFKSKTLFHDKFSNESHYLYYFNWAEDRQKLPTDPQQLKLA